MQFKTATHVITALTSLTTLTSLASAQGQTRETNITTDAAGTHYVGFRPDGGPLQIRDDVDTWTLAFMSGDSTIRATLTDANYYGVECPADPGQVCYSTRREGQVFVFEPSSSTPGAYTIRQSGSAWFWIVEDNVIFPAGSADSAQAFYLNLD
ncbi:hypothetical protein BJX66DRAFT_319659 [Aspergillus keveii]|uniref:Uncharacterized protein n=1 Tax=Aspergillus keveii TaxID=714993 RepID=A0ABR4FHY2_9EURO